MERSVSPPGEHPRGIEKRHLFVVRRSGEHPPVKTRGDEMESPGVVSVGGGGEVTRGCQEAPEDVRRRR